MQSQNLFSEFNLAIKFAQSLRELKSPEEISTVVELVSNADLFGKTAERTNILSNVTSIISPNSSHDIIVEVESSTSGNISISGKLMIGCILNVRHQEERQFGFALVTDGTVTAVVSGIQTGTSGQSSNGIVIEEPTALPTPSAKKFRLTVSNHTAFSTKAGFTLLLNVQGGRIVNIS